MAKRQMSVGGHLSDIGRGLGSGLGGLVGGIGGGIGQTISGVGSGITGTISGVTNGSPWVFVAMGGLAYVLLHPNVSPAGASPVPATHPIARQTGTVRTTPVKG